MATSTITFDAIKAMLVDCGFQSSEEFRADPNCLDVEWHENWAIAISIARTESLTPGYFQRLFVLNQTEVEDELAAPNPLFAERSTFARGPLKWLLNELRKWGGCVFWPKIGPAGRNCAWTVPEWEGSWELSHFKLARDLLGLRDDSGPLNLDLTCPMQYCALTLLAIYSSVGSNDFYFASSNFEIVGCTSHHQEIFLATMDHQVMNRLIESLILAGACGG